MYKSAGASELKSLPSCAPLTASRLFGLLLTSGYLEAPAAIPSCAGPLMRAMRTGRPSAPARACILPVKPAQEGPTPYRDPGFALTPFGWAQTRELSIT